MKRIICFISIVLSIVAIVSAVYALSSKKEIICLNEE